MHFTIALFSHGTSVAVPKESLIRVLKTRGSCIVNLEGFISLTADWLSQLVECQTTVRGVVGSNPGRTNFQGL